MAMQDGITRTRLVPFAVSSLAVTRLKLIESLRSEFSPAFNEKFTVIRSQTTLSPVFIDIILVYK